MTDATVFDLGKINARAIELGFLYADRTPDVRLCDIDDLIGAYITGREGFEPAFLGYNGFPSNCCISVNDQLVHGVGGEYKLQDGDILTIDCGVQHGDIIVDSADTHVIGEVTPAKQKLMDDGREILAACMAQVRDGISLYDIMRAGYNLSLEKKVYIVPDYGGHTIEPGKLHGSFIPHAPERRKDPQEQANDIDRWRRTKLRAGQIICLEPVVTEKPTSIILEDDGWTTRSDDGTLSVHYEHCMLITEDGYEVIC